MNLSKNKNNSVPEDNNNYDPYTSLSELNYNVNQLFTYQSSQQLPRSIQEQNEIITPPQVNDDHDVISGEETSCRHCLVVWNRGRPQILKRHLARECANVPQQIKEIWRDSLAMEEKTIKRRNKIESR
ncbi:9478_t:CDS:2, partial [Dentiscutata erythropus]